MKRRGLQLSRGHKFTIYAVSLALFLSGVFWAWIQHLDEAGKAGEGLRQAKTWLIEIHGFSAMIFVLLFGTLLAGHVRRAWRARKNRNNGVFFITSVGSLTLSGYALYYVGNENWRNAVSDFHLWLGNAAPALLLWHIWFGRRATRN
jgi:hypothetical protein